MKRANERTSVRAHDKSIIVCVLFCLGMLFSSVSFAQTLPQNLEAHYAGLTAWSADFEQTTYIEMLDQKAVKTGKIAVRRQGKVRVEYVTEPSKIYACNGKKLWVYKETEDMAWQFDKPKDVMSAEAWSFLSGLSNMSQLFNVSEVSAEPDGPLVIINKKLKKIYLTPKQQDAVQKIIVGIDAGTLTIQEAVLYNTSGNITHYLFKDVALNPTLDDTIFNLPAEPKRKIVKK